MLPSFFFGTYNVAYQELLNINNGNLEGITLNHINLFLTGLQTVLPIYIVVFTAGGLCELTFALIRGHEINEGFLVTGFLIPLTLPPAIPLWMAAIATVFGVIIGKEIFGGTGFNIFNPALTARAFLFLHIQQACLVIRFGQLIQCQVQLRYYKFLLPQEVPL